MNLERACTLHTDNKNGITKSVQKKFERIVQEAFVQTKKRDKTKVVR